MTQITLSDYVGFIFSEVVRARSIADAETKRIALLYKDDEILKNFSVPRFKIPEMDLTVPVLVSGARFKSTLKFNVQPAAFSDYVNSKLDYAVQTIQIKKSGIDKNFEQVKGGVFSTPILVNNPDAPKEFAAAAGGTPIIGAPLPTGGTVTLATLIGDFYNALLGNTDPAMPDNIVQINWARLFDKKISDAGLFTDYKTLYPNGELFIQTSTEVLTWVKNNTVVSRSEIENLLVSPETQTVKDGSNENSVFLVKAKIVEDGVFIKEVVDGNGVVQERIVEFD